MFRNILLFIALGVALPLQGEGRGVSSEPAATSEFRLRTILTRDRNEVNIRFSVNTGQAWLIDRNKSEPVKEQGSVPEGMYDVAVMAGDSTWWAFRIERKSGKVWNLSSGQWVETIEPATVAEGEYEVQLLGLAGTIWIRRFDQLTGRLWFGKWNGKSFEWIEMGGNGGTSVPPAPLPVPPSPRSLP